MELKKSPKADLENFKSIFFQVGMVVVLGLVLFAFEWSSDKGGASSLGSLDDADVEEEIIPITRQEIKPPPPPPPPPQVTEVLNIVEDDVEIEEELEIEDTEAEEDTEVEIVEVVEEEVVEEEVFFIVEDMPEFPGGDAALRTYIAKSVRYPDIARENGIQGRVFVQFVVNSKGKVEKVQVARGVDPALDKEAVRIIESLPDWKPGKQRGKPVSVSYTVPIHFKLG